MIQNLTEYFMCIKDVSIVLMHCGALHCTINHLCMLKKTFSSELLHS